MRVEAHKGLKELNDKNNSLLIGDLLETAIMAVPAISGIGEAMKLSRVGRNMLRGGALAATMFSEGSEEGRQWLWQQNYINNVGIDDNKTLLQSVGNAFADDWQVAKAMFGAGRPDMYMNDDFRNSVRSGVILGCLS